MSTAAQRQPSLTPRHFDIPRCGPDAGEMLDGLAELEFTPRPASPLQKLCEAGSEYGLRTLEKRVSSELLSLLQSRPKRRLKDHLRQILARATRPCLALELKAFHCAYEVIYSPKDSLAPEIEQKFLGERPYDRLISLFKKFPVLVELWYRLFDQWCDSVSELLARVDADKQTLSRVFFRGRPLGEIVDVRAGLSDPHNKGRTVMRVQFRAGPLIYKPRSGHGEQEWFRFIACFNAASFRPKLTAARVLCHAGYCWMEEVKSKPCKDQAAARRFYKRLGGMIAAAYLLKAVDCHRDNVIACGEHPVLVDAEALWHLAGEKKTDLLDPLYRTGFLPSSSRRSSYQYRSSVLGRTAPGRHTPYVAAKPLAGSCYEKEIMRGFSQAWRCLVGTEERRTAFARYLQCIQGREWRRIYRSTAQYDTIMRASIQPAAMLSEADRNLFIARSCDQSVAGNMITREEINALKRVDIPYFIARATTASPLPEDKAAPAKLINALRRAVHL